MTNTPIDLKARAHQAMLEAGFRPDFPADVLHEVQLLKQAALKDNGPAVRDLRSILWSSIDNDSSRDLDQVEYVEKLPDGATRLLIGIADVDASVPKGSATDGQAAAETTSVYAGVTTFPMLPGELSLLRCWMRRTAFRSSSKCA
jgi:exoribonuclease-2